MENISYGKLYLGKLTPGKLPHKNIFTRKIVPEVNAPPSNVYIHTYTQKHIHTEQTDTYTHETAL